MHVACSSTPERGGSWVGILGARSEHSLARSAPLRLMLIAQWLVSSSSESDSVSTAPEPLRRSRATRMIAASILAKSSGAPAGARPHNLNPSSRVHAEELVLAFPDLHHQGAARGAAGRSANNARAQRPARLG